MPCIFYSSLYVHVYTIFFHDLHPEIKKIEKIDTFFGSKVLLLPLFLSSQNKYIQYVQYTYTYFPV